MSSRPYAIVLGIAQDGGYPQAGCRGSCCAPAWTDCTLRRHVACLGVVDPLTSRRYLIDATPDLPTQLHLLQAAAALDGESLVDGILLTHAHMGHYTGLMHLGPEAAAARGVRVYAMPRLRRFLEANSPWDALFGEGHLELCPLADGRIVELGAGLSAVPFLVQHRDEVSETVGFRIHGPEGSVSYIPDVDTIDGWSRSLQAELASSDAVLFDGTFYSASELPGRDLSQIPHPLITDTMARLTALPRSVRGKLRFTHLNHSNPLLRPGSPEAEEVIAAGFRIAAEGERIEL